MSIRAPLRPNTAAPTSFSVGHELVQIAARLSSSRINERVNALLWRMIPYQDVAEVRDLREAARLLRVEPSR